ncbi:uncharacterized protein N7529_010509 [Penicillium soppii]|uniref:uncharacterized protein n=1 Tax=Penicillium soppii TaxID=69789 RepID=UPI0025472CF9|nr:uncharacterized protein N7529_010509 [Penicillium soppii]KAJ5856565.1 hypothetical protein N7529_010509 [Penicillium soppii]
MSQLPSSTDILVTGGGNAGLRPALSAAETNPALTITVINKVSRPGQEEIPTSQREPSVQPTEVSQTSSS